MHSRWTQFSHSPDGIAGIALFGLIVGAGVSLGLWAVIFGPLVTLEGPGSQALRYVLPAVPGAFVCVLAIWRTRRFTIPGALAAIGLSTWLPAWNFASYLFADATGLALVWWIAIVPALHGVAIVRPTLRTHLIASWATLLSSVALLLLMLPSYFGPHALVREAARVTNYAQSYRETHGVFPKDLSQFEWREPRLQSKLGYQTDGKQLNLEFWIEGGRMVFYDGEWSFRHSWWD
jgi:hypothetical protein